MNSYGKSVLLNMLLNMLHIYMRALAITILFVNETGRNEIASPDAARFVFAIDHERKEWLGTDR